MDLQDCKRRFEMWVKVSDSAVINLDKVELYEYNKSGLSFWANWLEERPIEGINTINPKEAFKKINEAIKKGQNFLDLTE